MLISNVVMIRFNWVLTPQETRDSSSDIDEDWGCHKYHSFVPLLMMNDGLMTLHKRQESTRLAIKKTFVHHDPALLSSSYVHARASHIPFISDQCFKNLKILMSRWGNMSDVRMVKISKSWARESWEWSQLDENLLIHVLMDVINLTHN